MRPRHPLLPNAWLFSDERSEAGIAELASLLPPGSGIVLRHDSMAPGAKAKQKGLEHLFEKILVPTEKVVEVRRGRKVDAERKFFPAPLQAPIADRCRP
jgi:hypothetical protein